MTAPEPAGENEEASKLGWPQLLLRLSIIPLVPTLLILYIAYRPMAWDRIDLELSKADSPEAAYAEIKAASLARNWPKFYGCLTSEARCEQLCTMMIDIGHAAHRARLIREGKKPRSNRFVTPDYEERCRKCLAVFDKFGLGSGEKYPFSLWASELDEFIKDGWAAMAEVEHPALIEADATLGEVTYSGDFAIAKVTGYWDRYAGQEHGYMRFQKVGQRWLVDMSPWWMPWGPSYRDIPKGQARYYPVRARWGKFIASNYEN